MTIMIVDDNPRMRQMIRLMIAHPEDSVIECADGSAAVRDYPTVRPDWVLMDIEMEPMNGFEASSTILSADPAAHIVIVTQHDDSAFRSMALKVGARGYVLKDRLLDLLSIIRPN